MEVIPKSNRPFMPKALEVKPSGLQPQDPYVTHAGSIGRARWRLAPERN